MIVIGGSKSDFLQRSQFLIWLTVLPTEVFILKTIPLSSKTINVGGQLMEDAVNIKMAGATTSSLAERHAADLLELFYPVHYRGNMAVEEAMRGELSRKQAAILWLIRSAGNEGGRSMRRKEIVLRLQDWFDVSSPAITQALRRMARPPMGLVRLVEDADSAREKRVILTLKGEEFIQMMVERGRAFLQSLMRQLPGAGVSGGIEFLRAAVAAVERVHSNGNRR
jgi:DNA-binding MarR family transcriptional regulator